MYAPTQQGMVAAFYYEKLGRLPTPEEARVYLFQEISELMRALANEGPEAQLKEMQDVRYTLAGYELARGWNGTLAFELVHESNMTKPAAPDGGKIQKGDSYVPPDMGECIGGEA